MSNVWAFDVLIYMPPMRHNLSPKSVKFLFLFSISWIYMNEPAHEIMSLFVLRKLIIQTRMRRHPVGLDVWFLVGPFVYFHTSCVRTVKAVARLCGFAGSPVADVISTIISWAITNVHEEFQTTYAKLLVSGLDKSYTSPPERSRARKPACSILGLWIPHLLCISKLYFQALFTRSYV